MKGLFATLVAAPSAIALLAGNAVAHPGHSPTDVTAQLAAPTAGPDHVLVFATISVLAALGVTRLVIALRERNKRTAMIRTT